MKYGKEITGVVGADPTLFSNAVPTTSGSTNVAPAAPGVLSNPFMEPQFQEPAPRPARAPREHITPEEPAAEVEAVDEPATDPETIEVSWEILRPQDFVIETGTGENNDQTTDRRKTLPGRFAWLNGIIQNWGDDARLAIGSFGDEERYRIAVLPTTIGGVAVEHAIAETETAGNRAFVLHAEATLGIDGNPEYSWVDVFSGTKPEAEALGAQGFNHTPTINQRIAGFLDAPYTDND